MMEIEWDVCLREMDRSTQTGRQTISLCLSVSLSSFSFDGAMNPFASQLTSSFVPFPPTPLASLHSLQPFSSFNSFNSFDPYEPSAGGASQGLPGPTVNSLPFSFTPWAGFSQESSGGVTQGIVEPRELSGDKARGGVEEIVKMLIKDVAFLPHNPPPSDTIGAYFPTLVKDLQPGGCLHISGQRGVNNISGFYNNKTFGISVFTAPQEVTPGIADGDDVLVGSVVDDFGYCFEAVDICVGYSVRVLKTSKISKNTTDGDQRRRPKRKGDLYLYTYIPEIINSLLTETVLHVRLRSPWTDKKMSITYTHDVSPAQFAEEMVSRHYNVTDKSERGRGDDDKTGNRHVPMMRKQLDALVIQAAVDRVVSVHRRRNRMQQKEIEYRMKMFHVRGPVQHTVYMYRRKGQKDNEPSVGNRDHPSEYVPWKFLSTNPRVVHEDGEENGADVGDGG